MAKLGSIRSSRAKGLISAAEEARLYDLAKYSADAPSPAEIRHWFAQDLAGQTRTPIKELRKVDRDKTRKRLTQR